VLKKAVIEEQKKTANLREIIRTKDQAQRRVEQVRVTASCAKFKLFNTFFCFSGT
jgi:Predicted coiled-coil domain-containing protein